MRTYNSYLFRTKDPVIDELRTIIQDNNNGKLTRKELKKIEQDGGPKVSTGVGLFFGKTRRPANSTVEAIGRNQGYHRPWRKMTASDQEYYVKAGRMKNGKAD